MRTTIDAEWAREQAANPPKTDADKVRLTLATLFAVGPIIGKTFEDGEVTEDLLRIADRLEEMDQRQYIEAD